MCAAVLKNWREAATLLLVNCRKSIKTRLTNELNPSTIEIYETTIQPEEQELDVLVLKRGSQSSFNHDSYVFPGGVANNADFDRRWLPVFGAYNDQQADTRFGFASESAPMFQRKRKHEFSAVPCEIALRICAIRETFEESGILVARSVDQATYQHNTEAAISYSLPDLDEMDYWREKVVEDPRQFRNLCENLAIVPDIWSLYDWSNWLTPTSMGDKRFDTAFFICCLGERPQVWADAFETLLNEWARPQQLIEGFSENRVKLAPPQLFELSRLNNFSNSEALLRFLQTRVGMPMERWMPVIIKCTDATIFSFPGDSLYPENPNIEEGQPPMEVDQSLKRLTRQCTSLNRVVIGNTDSEGRNVPETRRRFQVECTHDLPFGHITPRIQDYWRKA